MNRTVTSGYDGRTTIPQSLSTNSDGSAQLRSRYGLALFATRNHGLLHANFVAHVHIVRPFDRTSHRHRYLWTNRFAPRRLTSPSSVLVAARARPDTVGCDRYCSTSAPGALAIAARERAAHDHGNLGILRPWRLSVAPKQRLKMLMKTHTTFVTSITSRRRLNEGSGSHDVECDQLQSRHVL